MRRVLVSMCDLEPAGSARSGGASERDIHREGEHASPRCPGVVATGLPAGARGRRAGRRRSAPPGCVGAAAVADEPSASARCGYLVPITAPLVMNAAPTSAAGESVPSPKAAMSSVERSGVAYASVPIARGSPSFIATSQR